MTLRASQGHGVPSVSPGPIPPRRRVTTALFALNALALALVLASACGAHAREQPRDPQAERIAELTEERDALVRRVEALERELARPRIDRPTAPNSRIRAIVLRRWIERLSTDGEVLTLRLCVRSFEPDQLLGGQTFFHTSDLCGTVESDGREGDPAVMLPALLADEQFACWMLAAPDRSLPDCFREFATQHWS